MTELFKTDSGGEGEGGCVKHIHHDRHLRDQEPGKTGVRNRKLGFILTSFFVVFGLRIRWILTGSM